LVGLDPSSVKVFSKKKILKEIKKFILNFFSFFFFFFFYVFVTQIFLFEFFAVISNAGSALAQIDGQLHMRVVVNDCLATPQ
jgi:hypothetical protein